MEVTGGNIGYGVLKPLSGNSMKGGSVTISEEVQLERCHLKTKLGPGETVPTEENIRITVYDNQLPDGTYQADISLYRGK